MPSLVSSRLLCFVVVCCVLARGVRAQSAGNAGQNLFRIDHIGVNDGLTQGSVYYMLKDSRGFLWLGTQDGLNRYDGHRFRTYRPILNERGLPQPGTLRGVNIFGILEDPSGDLWVGTEAGLNHYDRRRDRFDYIAPPVLAKKRLVGRTLPFYADANELLYISDTEGLVRFNYHTGQRTTLAANLHPTNEYDLQSSTVRTPTGDVWLHAPKGIVRYNLRDKTIAHYFSDRPDNRLGSTQAVFSFMVDADNIVWIGTGAGLIRFDYRNSTYQTYDVAGNRPVSAIYSIAADQRGRLWLGTQRDGVLFFDTRSRLFGRVNGLLSDNRPLTDFEISKIYVDDLGIVWANADPDGLVRIVPSAFLFGGMTKRQVTAYLPADQTLSHYTVRGFMEERFDRLWIATDGGIDVLDPRTNRIVQRYLTDADRSDLHMHTVARSLYRDPQRRIWIGTTGGVLAFRPKTQTFEPIQFGASASLVAGNYVRNMVSVADTLLLAATEDGIYALNTLRRRWSKVSHLGRQNIFSFWYDAPARQLWVGTHLNGYFCYQLPGPSEARAGNGLTWRLLRSGLGGYTVLHIRPDAGGQTLYLSCDRGLVALKPRTGRFQVYTEAQGLVNSFVYGTLTDAQQNIWLSTNRGLSRIDPVTQTVKNFAPMDGIQGYEFNGNAFLRVANGELYFGGVNGFNRFRPDLFRNSSFNPHVHIYSLNVNEEPYAADTYVGEANGIRLDHNQNTLSLEFAALDFVSNGHNAYQYQLSGYDERWVLAGERNYVRYANLPPGDYTFLVKAANRDGHWSNRVRRLAIAISPPFWRTWPFISFLIALLVLGMFGWVRRREEAIRQQQAERVRLAYEIQEQVKKDIARDLHDEIGTRLATLKLYTTQLTQKVGETPSLLSLKTTIFTLINDTISDVRNLLRKLNPKTLEQHGYVAAIEELFGRINASGIVRAEVIVLDSASEGATQPVRSGDLTGNRLPTNVEVMLYRITQELVSNSLKHANAHQLTLQLRPSPSILNMVYSDDGSGFDYDWVQQKGAGLGLGSVESRVALLNGKITWQTQPGSGLRVTIDIPIGRMPKRRFYQTLANLSGTTT